MRSGGEHDPLGFGIGSRLVVRQKGSRTIIYNIHIYMCVCMSYVFIIYTYMFVFFWVAQLPFKVSF